LQDEVESLNLELENEKDNVKKLKKERADLYEKLENLNKELLNSKSPAPAASTGPSIV